MKINCTVSQPVKNRTFITPAPDDVLTKCIKCRYCNSKAFTMKLHQLSYRLDQLQTGQRILFTVQIITGVNYYQHHNYHDNTQLEVDHPGTSRATAGPGKPFSRGPITNSFRMHRDRSRCQTLRGRKHREGCPLTIQLWVWGSVVSSATASGAEPRSIFEIRKKPSGTLFEYF